MALFKTTQQHIKDLAHLAKWIYMDATDQNYNSEEKSQEYDELAHKMFHRHRLGQFIVELLQKYHPHDPADKLHICERAAGGGIITHLLYENGYTNIRATDLNATQLEVLKQKLPNIHTAVENINDPIEGIENDSFDVMLQVGATRFITAEGQRTYVKEAYRTLKEGALLIWPVFVAEEVLSKVRHGLGKHKSSSYGIAWLLEETGFEIAEAPLVVHGRYGSLSGIVLVAKKLATPQPISKVKSALRLTKMRKEVVVLK